ncbi:hypothetical protein [Ensifer sp. LC163]|uniref:hypothetical protein n=1 Tax=Ensifer sp. LC163 TaxID=1120652 RepID=UPI0008133087|nr:hypothetical protein [Ensifer sp. LC163]OCP36135.1 hypothetical protein BC360_25690 [Ensifer sp. LC163]
MPIEPCIDDVLRETVAVYIRVTKNEDGSIRREMMDGDYKVRDVSKAEVITMLQQFASTLRYD